MEKCKFHIERVKLSELKLDTSNLRGHDEAEIALLERSLTIFGQFRSLLPDLDDLCHRGLVKSLLPFHMSFAVLNVTVRLFPKQMY